jgi:hypothetical protein
MNGKMKMENVIDPHLAHLLNSEGYTPDRDGVLQFWEKTKKRLENIKSLEMELRKVAVKLTVTEPKEGMNTVELGNGYQAKAQIKYNYKLASNDVVETCLDEIAKIGNEGAFIADRLVSWTPNFLFTEYRQLQEEAQKGNETAKQILNKCNKMLTITEAAPTLEIKQPKEKK